MDATEKQQQGVDGDATDPIHIPVAELAIAVWRRRRFVAIVTGIGMICAIAGALLTPNEYQSTAELMPPDPQSVSSTSVLGALTGQVSISPTGSLLNAKTPGATSIGILRSRTAQDDIIHRFDLKRVYHCKLDIDARRTLTKRTTIEEDKKNGIISISVMDRDQYRARDIVKAYIEELDKLVNLLSTSSARREREFLAERLGTIKVELDGSTTALSSFSSRNATLDYQRQGEATVAAAEKLQGELMTAESELSGLKAMYADDNVRVRGVKARIGELQIQLRKIGGEGENLDSADLKTGQLFPSVRKLPLLGAAYYDLSRQVAMKEALYETLTKQYELAKVQEAKEIPTIKVLDEPNVPETKSYPHRILIILFCTLASAFACIAWIIATTLWHRVDNSNPVKVFGTRMLGRTKRHEGPTQV